MILRDLVSLVENLLHTYVYLYVLNRKMNTDETLLGRAVISCFDATHCSNPMDGTKISDTELSNVILPNIWDSLYGI